MKLLRIQLIPIITDALRREITSDRAQGHLFWKDGMGWNNWTYFFRKAQDDKDHTFSLYVSDNVAW